MANPHLKQKYDVCIIGGGPAGLWAAKSASKHNLDTLVIEKKREIGIPTVCGEFVPSEEEANRLLPGSKLVANFYRSLPTECIKNKTKTIRIYAPSGRAVDFKFEALIIDRCSLEKSYADKVEEFGGEILKSTVALNALRKDEIIVKFKGSDANGVSTNFLIGADGFPSKVAAWFKLCSGYNKSRDEALSLNSLRESVEIEEDVVEVYSGKTIAPGGYAWIIPKGDGTANVGVGVRRSWISSQRNIQDYFNHFLFKHPIASNRLRRSKTGSVLGKVIPMGGLVKEVGRDVVMLAGDAAGLVVPINGSGILTAAISGMLAGEAVWQETVGKGGVTGYRNMILSEVGDPMEIGLLYRRFVDLLVSHDSLLDSSFILAGKAMVANTFQCHRNWMFPILRNLMEVNSNLLSPFSRMG